MNKAILIIILFLVTLTKVNAQLLLSPNLVQNPSFENYTQCPDNMSQIIRAYPWSDCNGGNGSSDYFNICATILSGVTPSVIGQYPRTGNGEAGIHVFAQGSGNHLREYIIGKLNTSLIYNKRYCGDFYVSLNNYSHGAISTVGMYFSVDTVSQINVSLCLCSLQPQIENQNGIIIDTINWVKIKGSFIASGGEKYLTIGNFRTDNNSNYLAVGYGNVLPYYFMDDVSVCECNFKPNLGKDTTLCISDSLLLKPNIPNAIYTWQDGSTDTVFYVTQGGTYWVKAYFADYNITTYDTIVVNYISSVSVSLPNDTTLCQGQSLFLDATSSSVLYHWQDSTTNPTYNVTHQGKYWIRVSHGSCIASDTINVTYKPNPIVNLGNDTTLCYGQTITLNASLPNATYKWQDNSTNASYTVSPPYTPYIFWVKVTVDNCSSSDTIQIYDYPVPQVNLGSNSTLCQGQSILLDATTNNAVYQWQNGLTQATYLAINDSTYWVKVTDTTTNCSTIASITFTECIKDIVIPNIFTPNGDGFNDYFFIKDAEGWNISIQIYNRWGIKVYEDTNYQNNWDGKDLADGVYYYIIKAINKDNGIKKEYNGSVTILR